MRVYRHQFKNHAGETKLSGKWYLEFRDHLETVRRLPGFTDKKSTEELGRKLERLVACKVNAEHPDAGLAKWLAAMPNSLRSRLVTVGLIDDAAVARQKPLAEHLEAFRQSLLAKGGTTEHVDTTCRRLAILFADCRFRTLADLKQSKVEQYLANRRAKYIRGQAHATRTKVKPGQSKEVLGLSRQTSNYYLARLKQFCRWAVREGHLAQSPVEFAPLVNAAVDRVERRALSTDEQRRLLATTQAGPPIYRIHGPERALIYRLALESGLRANEIKTLRRSSFRFGAQSTVVVEAANSKHRQKDELPLRPDTAALIEAHLAAKPASAAAFRLPRLGNLATMLRRDLAAARAAWIEEAPCPEERAERERSEFLAETTAEGYVDFHGCRHTMISSLARAGVHPKRAQKLARHSTITLTMNRYTHVSLGDQAEALAMLPSLEVEPLVQTAATEERLARRLALSLAFPGSPSVPACQSESAVGKPTPIDAKRGGAKKKGPKQGPLKDLKEVDRAGVEPATPGFSVQCSTN